MISAHQRFYFDWRVLIKVFLYYLLIKVFLYYLAQKCFLFIVLSTKFEMQRWTCIYSWTYYKLYIGPMSSHVCRNDFLNEKLGREWPLNHQNFYLVSQKADIMLGSSRKVARYNFLKVFYGWGSVPHETILLENFDNAFFGQLSILWP